MGIELSRWLKLTPDQLIKRRTKWEKREQLKKEGKDPDKVLAEERAIKALAILKKLFEGHIELPPAEVNILKAIVVKHSTDDFYFLARYVLDMNLMFERVHKKWADDLVTAIKNGKHKIMRLKPRGTLKTSLYSVSFILWLWGCQSPQIRILYTSASGLLINEVSDKLGQYIGTEKADTLYSFIFGVTRDSAAKNTNDVFNIMGRSGKGFSLILKTAGSSTVGIHPNIILIDDPCLVGTTPVLTIDGYKQIKNIVADDLVLTRHGYKRVISSGITRKNAAVYDYNINGCLLTMTANHKVITDNYGKKSVSDLDNGDIIIKYEGHEWKYEKLEMQKSSNSMESNIDGIHNQKREHTVNILCLVEILKGKFLYSIGQFGSFIMEIYRRGIMFITRMVIFQTTISRISKLLTGGNIVLCIQKLSWLKMGVTKNTLNILTLYAHLRTPGTNLQKGENDAEKYGSKLQKLRRYVNNVVANIKSIFLMRRTLNIAQKNVDSRHTKNSEYQITPIKRSDVYNLTVEDCHEFIANGLLVSNCDVPDRESEATRQQKERWFDSLTPLIVPFYNEKTKITFKLMMYIGTVWHLRDLIWYITEVINKKLPIREKWDVERESIYGPDGKSAFPELLSDDDLEVIKATMTETGFACQYMNQALPEGLQIFDLNRITLVRPDQIDLTKGELLCVFDPSYGKSSSDYPAVWWVHYFEDNLTFFDAIDVKTELSLLIHHIASRNKEYGCRKMIFEDNGAILIKESLKKAHEVMGHHIFIDSVHHSTNKDERIHSMQPDIYSGFARFMEDYKTRYPEAMNQIVFYPAYGKVDFPDCAQIAIEHYKKPRFQFVRYEGCL